jgi:hypothetical protein
MQALGDAGLRELERRALNDPEAAERLNQEFARRRLWDRWEAPDAVSRPHMMRPNDRDRRHQECLNNYPCREIASLVPTRMRDKFTGTICHERTMRLNRWASIRFDSYEGPSRHAEYSWELRLSPGTGISVHPGKTGYYNPNMESLPRMFARMSKIWEAEGVFRMKKQRAKDEQAAAEERRDRLAVAFSLAGIEEDTYRRTATSITVGNMRFALKKDGFVELKFRTYGASHLTVDGALRVARVLQEELENATKAALDA